MSANQPTDASERVSGSEVHTEPVGDEGPADDGDADSTSGWRGRVRGLVDRRLLLVGALFAVASTVPVGLAVVNAPRLSPFDEWTHADYAWRASQFEQVRTGDPISEFVRERWSCRGVFSETLPPCGVTASPDVYPTSGVQYNAKHPPTYYYLTGITSRVLARAADKDFIDVARTLGAVWLFAAMAALYGVLRSWKVDWRFAAGAGMLLPLYPLVLHANSTVNNDAAAPLGGVAALYVLGRVLRDGNAGWLVPALLTALVASTKVVNVTALLAVAVVALALALYATVRDGARGSIDRYITPAAILVATAVVQVGWDVFTKARARPDYESPIAGVSTRPLEGLPFDEWMPTLLSGFRLGDSFFVDPTTQNSPYLIAWATGLGVLTSAAVFVGLAMMRRGSFRFRVIVATAAGLLLYPLVVQGQALLRDEYFPFVSARYGMSIVPMVCAALAIVAAERRLVRTSSAVVLTGIAAVWLSGMGVA